MLALLLATHLYYPEETSPHRYDFITLAAIGIQAAMLAFRLETWSEAKVILIFHLRISQLFPPTAILPAEIISISAALRRKMPANGPAELGLKDSPNRAEFRKGVMKSSNPW
jgi:hypothetical protein